MVGDVQLTLKFGQRTYSDAGAGINDAIRLLRQTWAGEAEVVSRALKEYLNRVAGILAERHSGAWPGGTTATTLSKRTGQSVDSIVRSVSVSGTTWERLSGTIGGRKTLMIHETGGTITSKGKLMTIPLPAAMSGRGTSPPFARQWKNTFVARSRAGNLIIFQRRGREIVPLYVLKSSVRIPARLGMRKELQTQIPYFLSRAADLVVRDVMQQLG